MSPEGLSGKGDDGTGFEKCQIEGAGGAAEREWSEKPGEGEPSRFVEGVVQFRISARWERKGSHLQKGPRRRAANHTEGCTLD